MSWLGAMHHRAALAWAYVILSCISAVTLTMAVRSSTRPQPAIPAWYGSSHSLADQGNLDSVPSELRALVVPARGV
jgi:hypothetical protein